MAESFISFNNLDKSSNNDMITSFQLWSVNLNGTTDVWRETPIPISFSHLYYLNSASPRNSAAFTSATVATSFPEITESETLIFRSFVGGTPDESQARIKLSPDRKSLYYYLLSDTSGGNIWKFAFIIIPA
jgi:hypothetical protein